MVFGRARKKRGQGKLYCKGHIPENWDLVRLRTVGYAAQAVGQQRSHGSWKGYQRPRCTQGRVTRSLGDFFVLHAHPFSLANKKRNINQ